MTRPGLPPPPPPADLRAVLDEASVRAVRADRVRILRELGRRSLGPGRLLLLWAVAAVIALGWSLVGAGLMAFESSGPFSVVFGGVFALLGAGVMIPAGFWSARCVRRDRAVRRLLHAWAEVDPDPAADAWLRSPGPILFWALSSSAAAVFGLYVCFAAAAAAWARPGGATYGEVTYTVGFGTILWITGLLGLGKAGAHHRWAVRAFPPPPPVVRGR
ncbi:hypothetical protein ACFV7Q_13895 [Streptomyces sp. NPDC059851]|uniref:hypothetical protein n=1 Tax=Streptomyces sp. NPDC059851 TaxID=3346971 RepID=UPI003661AEBC